MNSTRQKNVKTSTHHNKTLDVHHQNRIQTLRALQIRKDEIQHALEKIDARLNELHALRCKVTSSLEEEESHANIANANINDYTHTTEDTVKEWIDLKDEQLRLQSELDRLHEQGHKDEISYLTDTASILFQYYDLIENNNSSSAANASHTHPSLHTRTRDTDRIDSIDTARQNSTSILSYFGRHASHASGNQSAGTGAGTVASTTNISTSTNASTSERPKTLGPKSRGALLDEYMMLTETNYVRQGIDGMVAGRATHGIKQGSSGSGVGSGAGSGVGSGVGSGSGMLSADAMPSTAICSYCKSEGTMVMMTNDGYAYCNKCHTVEYLIIDHDKPSYKDPPKEISYFAYKRINHFNEWLAQIQGKESTDIPEEVYDKILLEIKKQKIENVAELTTQKLKDILKKLKLNKYYEHCHHIINRINGMPMPHLTPELEDRLRSMFRQIQTPFLKYAPPNRKNFLAYSFCIYKMLQLIEKDEYLVYFPLLKSREKLQQQDDIWKLICKDLGWEFIKSL